MPEWQPFCRRASQISVDGENAVLVMTGDRRQRVEIRETSRGRVQVHEHRRQAFSDRFRARRVAQSQAAQSGMATRWVRVDRKGRLVGETNQQDFVVWFESGPEPRSGLLCR